MTETVAILGASAKPGRYAYEAVLALLENGHDPIPVNPAYQRIEGLRCFPDLPSIPAAIDTITVYVRPTILIQMTEDILKIRPKRVILNPGTESGEVTTILESAGVRVQKACTLILLNTSTF